MARCLVTGHKGYIGSKLFKKLQDLGHEVMGIDLKDEISKDIISYLKEDNDGDFHPYYVAFEPEYVFHLACWPRIGFSLEHPVETMRNNVMAGSVLLNFANKMPSVKRVIYSSSSSVVGNGNGPTNPYALHKLITEKECGIYSEVYALDTVCLRYFNVYSEDQPADGPYATVIANWMHTLRQGNTPFITGNGRQRRDMVHVDDVVLANIHCMEHLDRFDGKIFDVGTDENISINEIKKIVERYHDVEFDYVEARPGEVAATLANTQSFKNYGWAPTISIVDGVNKCFNFERHTNEK